MMLDVVFFFGNFKTYKGSSDFLVSQIYYAGRGELYIPQTKNLRNPSFFVNFAEKKQGAGWEMPTKR